LYPFLLPFFNKNEIHIFAHTLFKKVVKHFFTCNTPHPKMSKINFTPVFNRKNKLNKQGEAPVYIRANQNGKNIYFSTEIYLKPEFWNDNKKNIRNSHPHYITLNKEIESLQNDLINLSVKIKERNGNTTLQSLTDAYKNRKRLNNSFTDFYETEMHNVANIATLRNLQSTLRKIKEFRKNVAFDELTFQFLTEFKNYLQSTETHHNTIYKYFQHIKGYVNLAVKLDYIEANKNPFIKFSFKKIENKRTYLDTPEFLKVVTFTLPENSKLQRVFDMFLLALYTGLRISDIKDLRKSDIKRSLENGYEIDKDTIKTGAHAQIPIEILFDALNIDVPKQNTPSELIKRNTATKENNDLIFSILSDSSNYEQLQKLFNLIGIPFVGFHAARHTLAMYLLNERGLPTEGVGKLLAHRNIQTTLIYTRMTKKGLLNMLKVLRNDKPNQNKTQAM